MVVERRGQRLARGTQQPRPRVGGEQLLAQLEQLVDLTPAAVRLPLISANITVIVYLTNRS